MVGSDHLRASIADRVRSHSLSLDSVKRRGNAIHQ